MEQYIKEQLLQIRSVPIVRHGYLVFERYYREYAKMVLSEPLGISDSLERFAKEGTFKPRTNEAEITDISEPEINYDDRISEYIYTGFNIDPNIRKKDLFQLLGEPDKIETKEVENRHVKGSIDTVYRLFFDNLYLYYYYAANLDKYIISHVKISSDKYKCKYDLNVGQTKDFLLAVLGKPSQIKENLYYYTAIDLYTVEIVFEMDNDKISSISWFIPLD